MALSINNTVLGICAVAIGLVMIGSLLAPVVNMVSDDLTALDSSGNPIYENGASWSSLISVVVIICILGLIIVAINSYTNGRK